MAEHRHCWPYNDPINPAPCVEIGPTTCLRTYRCGCGVNPAGYIIAHDVAGATERCEGALAVHRCQGDPGEIWQQTGSLGDGNLTLSPSVVCSAHPEFHAYVQAGRWTG